VLQLKDITNILGWLNQLVAVGYINRRYLRERFGHRVYSYYPTQLGREKKQSAAYMRALFLDNEAEVEQHRMEL